MPQLEEILILLKEKFDSKESKVFLLLALTGIFFIGLGIFLTRSEFFDKPTVEILNNKSISTEKVFVEISGAVEKPGVYEFDASGRVDNALVAAGGLAASADRSWVEKNINRAALLKDGQKIYIPRQGEVSLSQSTSLSGGNSGTLVENVGGLVNINTATLSQLDRLEGIGAVRAQKIIDNRPYSSIDELITKKILPKNVFEGIKERITAP